MTRTLIPVEESFAAWREEPGYAEAYAALEEEFALTEALVAARAQAGLSQGEVAARMATSQPAVARLETGRGNPSLQTLQRYAKATGTRLSIRFEPIGPGK